MNILKLPLRRVHARRNLRGHGLGGLFARLGTLVKPLLKTAVQAAKPIAKQTLKELGKEGLSAASSTLSDVIKGVPIKQAVKKNVKSSAQRAEAIAKQGGKRALSASAKGVREDIKRRRQTGGASLKKVAKQKTARRPNRGIFS